MISSNILGNHYLSSFDRLIKKKVNPTFYGRYVDDVIIVFRNPKIDSKKDHFIPDFIEGKLCYTNTQQILGTKYKCAVARTSEKDFAISINSNELFFQLEKVKLYLLNKGDSIELIHSFEREIRKNTSEFKFQLETNDLIEGFEDSSYEITYDDTVNKLRSIEKMNTNKFGASKHLSKLINTVKQTSKVDTQKLEKVLTKIEELFSGQRALQLVSLWDKAFTLFVITRKQKGLIPFSRHLLHQIVRIRFNDEQLSIQQNEEIEANLKNSLLNQMILAFAMASALDISFFNTHIIKQLKTKATDRLGSVLKNLTQTHIKHLARQLIRSNLFRQSYLPFPLVNYCNQASTYSFNSPTLPKPTSFKLDETKVKYSPRFIHYHEVEMFYYLRSAFIGSTPLENSLKQRSDFVTRKFIELNRGNIRRFSTKAYPKAINESKGNPTWTINNAIRIKRLKVGLVNIQVHMAYMKEALNRKPILSFERLDSVNRVLNEAIRSRCHLIFFPEVSIPFQWLGRLMDFARRNNIGIICGIEHFINKNNEAFNYVATILPFALGRYRNAFIDLRLKIDYAPVEVAELKKYKRKVPKATKTERIRQYHWSGVSFSALNCFELTDINKRTNFKGAVDFLVTVEYNRDVAYFSSINESLARDLHCYVIQVNTAQFGDSRVTFPSESYSRDYIKIKGGRNISLITGELDITKLRQYQQISIDKKYMPRTLASQFKPLPPNFKLSPFRREVILPKKWSM